MLVDREDVCMIESALFCPGVKALPPNMKVGQEAAGPSRSCIHKGKGKATGGKKKGGKKKSKRR